MPVRPTARCASAARQCASAVELWSSSRRSAGSHNGCNSAHPSVDRFTSGSDATSSSTVEAWPASAVTTASSPPPVTANLAKSSERTVPRRPITSSHK